MDKKESEDLTMLLSNLSSIIHFNHASLFPEDVVEMTGMQIHCVVNKAGRLVYSLAVGKDVFDRICIKEYGYQLEEAGKTRDILTYPATGSDSLDDLSPATIVRILKLSEGNEDECIIPLFVLRIMDVAEECEKVFHNLQKKAKKIQRDAEKVYEEIL